jgi:type IV secretory pathway VirB3-like protein
MRSTRAVYVAPSGASVRGPRAARAAVRRSDRTDTVRDVLVKLLVAAGVLLFPVPALVQGVRGLPKHPGYSSDEPADRASYILVVALRTLVLMLVLTLSVVVLVSTVGAAVVGVPLHGMVYVFFGLDVLLALLIVVSFGRVRRPVRRRVNPAAP